MEGLPGDADSVVVDSVDVTVPLQSKSGLDKKVVYSAKDSIVNDLPEKKVYLYNNASIDYDGIRLKAYHIVVDFESQRVWAKGRIDSSGRYVDKPIFTDNGKDYAADSMVYNFKSKQGISSGAITSEQDGFVYGQKVMRDSMENIYVKGARFTTCNAAEPHFYIQANKLKITKNKQVVTGPANLIIEKIRTPLAIPFGFFPSADKQTRGIIFGNYGETADRGFFLRGFGFYTPLNDYFDLAVTGDFYFRGSFGLELRSAYKKRYKYNGNFSFKYNLNEFGEENSESYRTSRDVQLTWVYNQDSKAKPGRSFGANVNFVTSSYLRNNTFNVNDIVTNNVNSSVRYGRSFFNNNLNFTMNGRLDQNLAKQQVNLSLPDIALTLTRRTPFSNLRKSPKILKNLGFSYSSNFRNQATVHESSIFQVSGFNEAGPFFPRVMPMLDSFSNGIRHNLPVSTSFKAFKWFTVNPNLNFSDYWYFKTIRKLWDDSNDTLLTSEVGGFERAASYSASISIGTIIYGRKYFKRGKLKAISHVMRPSIGASFAPEYEGKSKFGYRSAVVDTTGTIQDYSIFENGIMGSPGGAASARLNFNLGNNIEIKVKSEKDTANGGVKKVKLIESLTLGSNYDFLRDSLQLGVFAINANTRLFEKINLTMSASLDPYQFDSTGGRSRRIDQFEINNGRLGRITSARVSMNTNLNPQGNKRHTSETARQEDLDFINANPNYFVDFSIPWSLYVNYNLRYAKPFGDKADIDQTVTFNGDVNLTENWKIGFSSGYNLTDKELTLTKIDIFRDLHCWEFQFGWIPTGFRRSFTFTIKVKSATLSDLKLTRNKFWFDG